MGGGGGLVLGAIGRGRGGQVHFTPPCVAILYKCEKRGCEGRVCVVREARARTLWNSPLPAPAQEPWMFFT